MITVLFGIFIILHGLVHLWYVVLSQGWVPYQPDMGWTGESWILSGIMGQAPLRWLATVLYSLAALGFVLAGIGILFQTGWWQPVLLAVAAFSSVIILIFWDGSRALIVQKGLLGLLINAVVILYVLVNRS